MLRISSEDERLIQDSEIKWYSRTQLLRLRSCYNFYITTDFATSEKQVSDYSVISVWAYGSNGDWFWVDGIACRQTMDKNFDDLFRLVQEYQPQQVGVETTDSKVVLFLFFRRKCLTVMCSLTLHPVVEANRVFIL